MNQSDRASEVGLDAIGLNSEGVQLEKSGDMRAALARYRAAAKPVGSCSRKPLWNATRRIPSPVYILYIYLDTYMLFGVYQEDGICVRNHCGAEPPRDTEPPGLVTTVSGRDRASASYGAADRVKAPACAARGRFRGIHGGRTAPSLPAETWTISAGRFLAGAVPPVLVRSRRCSRTPPRPHGTNETGSISTNEKED